MSSSFLFLCSWFSPHHLSAFILYTHCFWLEGLFYRRGLSAPLLLWTHKYRALIWMISCLVLDSLKLVKYENDSFVVACVLYEYRGQYMFLYNFFLSVIKP